MSKIDEDVSERNQYHKSVGKIQLVHFSNNEFGNLLGALYWKLHMGRKDTGFGLLLPENSWEGRRSNRQICLWEY